MTERVGKRPSIPPGGDRRALVVDDSRAMRTMLRATLEHAGFAVTEAHDGEHAFEQLALSGPLELALIDWNMPVLDGLSMIERLRSDRRYDRMVIVMVTSEAEPAQVERALSAGADEYLMKPLSAEMLVEKLRMLEDEGVYR